MTTFWVVEQLNVFKDWLPQVLARLILPSSDLFFLQVRKETLCHSIVMAIATTTHARFLYCEPWSECSMTVLASLRRQCAIVGASRIKSSFVRLRIDQTTMFPANRSIMTARNNHLVDGFSLKLFCVTRALTPLVPLVINYDFYHKKCREFSGRIKALPRSSRSIT